MAGGSHRRGEVFAERSLVGFHRRGQDLAAALRRCRPSLIAPTLGIAGKLGIDRWWEVGLRRRPRQKGSILDEARRPRRRAVDPTVDPAESTLTGLVRRGVSEPLHRPISLDRVAVAMDQPVQLSQRDVAVAANDRDDDRTQLDTVQRFRIDDRRRQRPLVHTASPPYMPTMRLRPQAWAESLQTVDHAPSTRRQDFEFGVDRPELVGVGNVRQPYETEMVRPELRFIATQASEKSGIEVGDRDHGPNVRIGTDKNGLTSRTLRAVTLLIVRHAHAGVRREWDGDDRLRPLSDRGQRQAGSIGEALAPYAPKRLFTSPAIRCRQTLEPLAEATGVEILDDDRLFENPRRADIESLVDDLQRKRTVVLSSHGDVIPALLHELAARGMTHDDRLVWQKASTWVVDYDKSSGWGAATYLAPPRGR